MIVHFGMQFLRIADSKNLSATMSISNDAFVT